MTVEVNGIIIALLELSIFFGTTVLVKKKTEVFKHVDNFSYYWLSFTVLTGIWEACFILNYHSINGLSQNLITNSEHAWTNKYTLNYVLPWKLADIFYAEYGAWADREYMISSTYWSRLIEGSHAGLCGLFSFLGLLYRLEHINRRYLICIVLAMGTQLMNSILYMGEYFLQVTDKDNVNYASDDFPTGIMLEKRAFMYVNIFWTLMPCVVLYKTILNKKPNLTDIDGVYNAHLISAEVTNV